MKNKPVTLTIDQYFDLVKVIRMLYGIEPATDFFEKNFNEFTGLSLSALQRNVRRANIEPTRETGNR